jgi:hypothetical protein
MLLIFGQVALATAVIVQTTQELIHVTEETKCAEPRQTFVVQNVVRSLGSKNRVILCGRVYLSCFLIA